MKRRRVQPSSEDDGTYAPETKFLNTLAKYRDSLVLPLTKQQKAVAHLTVDVAFCYGVPADEDVLVQSLSRVLAQFPVLIGRAVKIKRNASAQEELALCVPKANAQHLPWSFVPFSSSYEKKTNFQRSTNGIAPDVWFDMATGCIPTDSTDASNVFGKRSDESIDEAMLGDPMTRIKVTNVDCESTDTRYQVITLSINHALVDAGSVSLFMSAWSEEYQLCCDKTKSFDKESFATVFFDHPVFDLEQARPWDQQPVPKEWRDLLPKKVINCSNPFSAKASDKSKNEAASCTVYYRSQDQIDALKRQYLDNLVERQKDCDKVAVPLYLSSNDALCGELCNEVGATSILLCMDFRPVLGRKSFFGYAVLPLFLNLDEATDAPVACRRVLGWNNTKEDRDRGIGFARNRRFIEWLIVNETWEGQTNLIWNSWVKFFTMKVDKCSDGAAAPCGRPTAKMASVPYDMMMSETMCRTRIKVAEGRGRGFSYAIIFPQPNGVRVYCFSADDTIQSLLPSP